jgi:hypothetical protein
MWLPLVAPTRRRHVTLTTPALVRFVTFYLKKMAKYLFLSDTNLVSGEISYFLSVFLDLRIIIGYESIKLL